MRIPETNFCKFFMYSLGNIPVSTGTARYRSQFCHSFAVRILYGHKKMIKKIRSAWEDEAESDIYSEDKREQLLEDDEISSAEEAFMRGWNNL